MSKDNPRFIWNIGAIREQFPDIPELDELVLWDRQEHKIVVRLSRQYANAMCLELADSQANAPFTTLKEWFNGLSNEALESEGMEPTKEPFLE